eukprot:767454-Hanusia_phi.AAC.3
MQAASDSSIGTGKLFGRPTPAQLLKEGSKHAHVSKPKSIETFAQNTDVVKATVGTGRRDEEDAGTAPSRQENYDYGEVQIGKLYAISEEREPASGARFSVDGFEINAEANSTTDSSQGSNTTGSTELNAMPACLQEKSVKFDVSETHEIHSETLDRKLRTVVGKTVAMKIGGAVEDVLYWLKSIGFSQYEKTFALNRIDFEELFRLKDNDLKQMGISIKQNRRLLLEAMHQKLDDKVTRPIWYISEAEEVGGQKTSSKMTDKSNSAPKKGYVTWLDSSHRKSHRGYAIIQGASLHIFNSSEHVFLKPSISVQLESALIAFSSLAQHSILIQVDISKPTKDDLYIVADSKREAQDWLECLTAASNLQITQPSALLPVAAIRTYHIKLIGLRIQNSARLVKPLVTVGLVDKNGNFVSELNQFEVEPTNDAETKQEVSSESSISFNIQGEVTISRKVLQSVGQGAIIFFEIKGASQNQAVIFAETHYWAFAYISDLNNGPVRLNLRKKPITYDPLKLRSSANIKQMSFLSIECFVKDAAKKHEDKSTSTENSFVGNDWNTIMELATILRDEESSKVEKVG